jgi:hypothetical protein
MPRGPAAEAPRPSGWLRLLAKRRPSRRGGRRSSESLIGSSRVNVLHGPAGHWSREREGTGSVRGLGLTRQAGLGCVPRTGLLARSVLLLLVTARRADLTVAPTPPLVNRVSLPFRQRPVAGYSCETWDVPVIRPGEGGGRRSGGQRWPERARFLTLAFT